MKGRKLLYDTKLKPNGFLPEMDDWFHAKAKELGITYTELKRRVLVNYWQEAVRVSEDIEATNEQV